jgi:glycosyltransferase involved in cell wall biosynthesis
MALRVMYFGTYRAEYSRNRILRQALLAAGVDVRECHEPLWAGVEDRVQAASGGWANPKFVLRLLGVYTRLLWRGLRLRDYDILMCGYPGQLDVFFAWLISRLHRKPLVWDVFMSIYLIALERGLERRSAFSVGLLRRLEWLALRLPDRLVHDTRQYVKWLCATHGLAAGRFCLAPTSADESTFSPGPAVSPPDDAPFEVLYYGSYIPNHHVQTIVQAAALLRSQPEIRFSLVGEGPDLPEAQRLARELGLANLSFSPWLEQTALVARMRCAGLLLGAFGDTSQSLMTVHNKVYEGLAVGRAVLTGDSQAVRDALRVEEEILVCARKSPEALAQAILSAAAHPARCAEIGARGRSAFVERFSAGVVGANLRDCLLEKQGTKN